MFLGNQKISVICTKIKQMPFYHKLGKIPHKRHTTFKKEDGSLHYSLNRMGTNKAGGQLSYVFEGYKIIDRSEFQRVYGS